MYRFGYIYYKILLIIWQNYLAKRIRKTTKTKLAYGLIPKAMCHQRMRSPPSEYSDRTISREFLPPGYQWLLKKGIIGYNCSPLYPWYYLSKQDVFNVTDK
jgi:hypothetical protein